MEDPMQRTLTIEGQTIIVHITPLEYEMDPGVHFYQAEVANNPMIDGLIITEAWATSYHPQGPDTIEVALTRLERGLRQAIVTRRNVVRDFMHISVIS